MARDGDDDDDDDGDDDAEPVFRPRSFTAERGTAKMRRARRTMRNESTRHRGSFSPCTLLRRPCREARASCRSGLVSSEGGRRGEPEDDEEVDDDEDGKA